jgi:hypothetical protein
LFGDADAFRTANRKKLGYGLCWSGLILRTQWVSYYFNFVATKGFILSGVEDFHGAEGFENISIVLSGSRFIMVN